MTDSVYDLRIHESLKWSQNNVACSVIRVPGGWLYHIGNKQPVYVPFTAEGKLAEMIKVEKRYQKVATKRIIDVILKYHDLDEIKLYEKTRKRPIVNARYRVIYFVTKYMSKMTLETRGQIFNIDHSTVLHALKAVNNQIETDVKYRLQIIEIDNIIRLALIDIDKTYNDESKAT